MKKKLPFSLEEYKKLDNPERVTDSGLSVRIICTDNDNPDAPVVGLINGKPHLFTKDGEWISRESKYPISKIYILGKEELNDWETALQQVINDMVSKGRLLNADDIRALIRTYQALSTFVPYDYEIEALKNVIDYYESREGTNTFLIKDLNSLLERIKKYA